MLYFPKINDYLEILNDEEVKDFVSIREEQNLRKVAKSLYISLAKPDEVKKYAKPNPSDNCLHHSNVEIINLFDPDLQLINNKPVIKIEFKELLSKFKKFQVQTILVLHCKKRNDRKIFFSSVPN